MNLPFFYLPAFDSSQQQLTLSEETSRHIVQVLRMKNGEQLQLTNGEGALLKATIIDDHKKKTRVQVNEVQQVTRPPRKISLAVSPLKNHNRYEWMLEKVTEMGITDFIPVICQRTEKQKTRQERLQHILVSAMLQSRQVYLPNLHEAVSLQTLVENAAEQQKFIAHCADQPKTNLADAVNSTLTSQLMLIGPEGDFTPAEIEMALQHHFIPVALGENRLRTETAAVVAATLITYL